MKERQEKLGDQAAVKGTMLHVCCASALGYFEGALRLMKASGPVHVFEVACQCAGDPAVFDLSW